MQAHSNQHEDASDGFLPQVETEERHRDIARALGSFSGLCLEMQAQSYGETSYAALRFALVQELAGAPRRVVTATTSPGTHNQESNSATLVDSIEAFQLLRFRNEARKSMGAVLKAYPHTGHQ
ncbi:hypothetical protein FVE85_4508 [Porphyridium purpureum]|uniref:Uncharacterized protein n=1 Tax=Porphyridium purpureum TaxID=35688 RepID=A0A5J4YI37_PORPP|nr:hypothetical protein FVE85_4508 [Porphyridium purpureum]|eukprot:POR5050..scf297_16